MEKKGKKAPKTTPKDYGRWDNTGVKVISRPKTPKKKVKKGK